MKRAGLTTCKATRKAIYLTEEGAKSYLAILQQKSGYAGEVRECKKCSFFHIFSAKAEKLDTSNKSKNK